MLSELETKKSTVKENWCRASFWIREGYFGFHSDVSSWNLKSKTRAWTCINGLKYEKKSSSSSYFLLENEKQWLLLKFITNNHCFFRSKNVLSQPLFLSAGVIKMCVKSLWAWIIQCRDAFFLLIMCC